jgi:hypothetical protein
VETYKTSEVSRTPMMFTSLIRHGTERERKEPERELKEPMNRKITEGGGRMDTNKRNYGCDIQPG